MGTLFSSGLSSTGNTIVNNLLKGETLFQGLGQNLGPSLAIAGAGIAANYVGKGLTSLIGDIMQEEPLVQELLLDQELLEEQL